MTLIASNTIDHLNFVPIIDDIHFLHKATTSHQQISDNISELGRDYRRSSREGHETDLDMIEESK